MPELSAIDRLLREGLKDACGLARDNRGIAIALNKIRADGSAEALSNIDIKVEDLIFGYFNDDMPYIGAVAEEGLNFDPTPVEGVEWRLVLDPIDGSKYYLRDDGMNVCIMASLLRNRTVVATYIVDIATQEVIGFGPSSPDVFLWHDISFKRWRNLSEQTWPTALAAAKVIRRHEPPAHEDPWASLGQRRGRGIMVLCVRGLMTRGSWWNSNLRLRSKQSLAHSRTLLFTARCCPNCSRLLLPA